MKRTRLVGGVMAAAVALVGAWEGLRTVAYPDRLANNLPTVCYGWTIGVKLGDEYTKEECDTMLGNGLVEFERGMRKCLTTPDAIPDKTYVAFLSGSYNIGVGAFCGSSMARLANAGDLVGACEALTRWNKAGGKVVQGLVNRRAAERELCLAGVREGVAIPVPTPRPPVTVPTPTPRPDSPAATPPVTVPAAPSAPLWPIIPIALVIIVAIGVIAWRRRS